MTRNNIFKMVALSSAIALTLPMAVAAGPGKHERPSFEQLDINGDGKITQDEMKARGEARFKEADANGDGMLSQDELAAKGSERAAKHAAKMIERHDTDGDGQLSQDEMKSGMKGKKGHDRGAKMFEKADTDGDGGISKAEFDAMKEKMGERHGKKHGKKEQ